MTADRLKTEQAELARDISYLQDCVGSMTPDNIRAVRLAVTAAIVAAQGGGRGKYKTFRVTVEAGYDPAEVAREFCAFRAMSWHSVAPALGDKPGTVCFDVADRDDWLDLLTNSKIVRDSVMQVL